MKKYPGIQRACTTIAQCNNGIRRDRSEEQQIAEYEKWLEEYAEKAGIPEPLMEAIDEWLMGLTDNLLLVVCDGEATEMEVLMKAAPPQTNDMLNCYFEEVC